MRAVYATVEKVMRVTDVKASAFVQEEILDALVSASDDVDNLVKVGDSARPAFAPWIGAISFDWPVIDNDDSFRFWLDKFRLHSLTSMTSGGDDISSQALPWPASGAPYSAIDIDTTGPDSLDVGPGTGQRSLSISGTWGIVGQDRARSGWALGASASASAESMIINAPVGVGSLVLIEGERAIVTGRSWTTSGQTASALTAQMNDQAVTVASGAAFVPGEEIMVDGERLLIRDVAGNALIVQRAADGSTLAAHTAGAPIFWARSCSVERGVLGTFTASHANGAAVAIYRPPALAEQLTIAYAIERRTSETTGYARSLEQIQDRKGLSARKVGGDLGAVGIPGLEARVISAYGRIRSRAI